MQYTIKQIVSSRSTTSFPPSGLSFVYPTYKNVVECPSPNVAINAMAWGDIDGWWNNTGTWRRYYIAPAIWVMLAHFNSKGSAICLDDTHFISDVPGSVTKTGATTRSISELPYNQLNTLQLAVLAGCDSAKGPLAKAMLDKGAHFIVTFGDKVHVDDAALFIQELFKEIKVNLVNDAINLSFDNVTESARRAQNTLYTTKKHLFVTKNKSAAGVVVIWYKDANGINTPYFVPTDTAAGINIGNGD